MTVVTIIFFKFILLILNYTFRLSDEEVVLITMTS